MKQSTHTPPIFLAALATFLFSLGSTLSADVSTSELPVLTGTEVLSLRSETVGDAFVLYVRVPPDAAAQPDRKFPVIYALDGDHTFPMMCSVATELSWSGAVPAAIVVGIGYGTLDLENGNHRSRDLSPQPYDGEEDSGGGSRFLEFLLSEAFPEIQANIPADSEQRYLFGHSLGGLFSLYAYTKQPEAFQGIVAGSPFLAGQLELLEETAAGLPPRDCRLFVVTGDLEDPTYFIDDLKPLRSLLDSKWAAPDSYETVLLPGFDHFTMVAPSISMGLRAVFTQ
ncbi:alpha/beta hydrolase-fold protein [Pelagicoccus sp. SDUM812002]|uniref:alpha/beta hydrolase n=1 Tax=Pelagicoccus sp. SDUM812002 TaxID=3041266 RepID=UPI002810402C|nr:alpha/beta hydrolase-fold protein [Pelagicoccus sp. SDUM812002]MDQ8187416.1 alpha/beta hydrolase-fold protein [Pelagicoccus sp. SDUM812002]